MASLNGEQRNGGYIKTICLREKLKNFILVSERTSGNFYICVLHKAETIEKLEKPQGGKGSGVERVNRATWR